MIDIILILIILVAVISAVRYIYKAKKNGQKCIGCPYSKQCSKSKNECGHTEKSE